MDVPLTYCSGEQSRVYGSFYLNISIKSRSYGLVCAKSAIDYCIVYTNSLYSSCGYVN